MLENQIERSVCAYAQKLGFLTPKFSSPARAAVPDRLIIGHGKIFFIEFKATGKTPTPAQQREHQRYRDQGAVIFVVDDIIKGRFVVDMVDLGADLDKIYI